MTRSAFFPSSGPVGAIPGLAASSSNQALCSGATVSPWCGPRGFRWMGGWADEGCSFQQCMQQILSTALLLSRDSDLTQELRRGDLWEVGTLTPSFLLTLHLSSEGATGDTSTHY